jgi:hypothetical protein
MSTLLQLLILCAAFVVVLLVFLTVSYRLALRERDRRVAEIDTYQPVRNGEQLEHC